MKEARGNLWEFKVDAICITTNGFVTKSGDAVMGAGCALEARAKFPFVARELGKEIKENGNHVYVLSCVHGWYDGEEGIEYDTRVVSFPVKHHWREKADLALIERSARELAKAAHDWGWETVVVPRPGCGNGGLKWEDVKPVIEPILDDRFTVVTF